jgi:hypothetical protein
MDENTGQQIWDLPLRNDTQGVSYTTDVQLAKENGEEQLCFDKQSTETVCVESAEERLGTEDSPTPVHI